MSRSPYTDALDTICLSSTEKAQLKDLLATVAVEAGAQGEHPVAGPTASATPPQEIAPERLGRPTQPRRPSKRAAIVLALAATLVLGVAGLAVAAGTNATSLQTIVAHFFGAEPAATETVDQLGSPVGITETCDDVSVTLDSIMGDDHNLLFIFSLERTDQAAFNYTPSPTNNLPYLRFSTAAFAIGDTHTDVREVGCFDIDPSDNILQLVYYCNSSATDLSLRGLDARIVLFDLLAAKTFTGSQPQTFASVAEGPWVFELALDYGDAGGTVERALPTGQSLSYVDIDATVAELTLTPIQLTVRFDTSTAYTSDFFEFQQIAYHNRFFEQPVALVLTDGTTVELRLLGSQGLGWSYRDETTLAGDAEATYFADRILALDDVAAVTIGELVIPTGWAEMPDTFDAPGTTTDETQDGLDVADLETPIVSVEAAVEAVLGLTPGEQANGDPVATAMDLTCSNGGVTMSLDAVIGDCHNVICVFSVIRDDGSAVYSWDNEFTNEPVIALYNYEAWLVEQSWPRATSALAPAVHSIDIDPSDNAFQLVVVLNEADRYLTGSTIGIQFNSLVDENGAAVHPGTWSFEFRCAEPAKTRKLPVGRALQFDGFTGTVDEVSVSPIAVTATLTLDSSAGQGLASLPVSVQLASGEVIALNTAKHGSLTLPGRTTMRQPARIGRRLRTSSASPSASATSPLWPSGM